MHEQNRRWQVHHSNPTYRRWKVPLLPDTCLHFDARPSRHLLGHFTHHLFDGRSSADVAKVLDRGLLEQCAVGNSVSSCFTSHHISRLIIFHVSSCFMSHHNLCCTIM